MAIFKEGQTVRARHTVQGLTERDLYRITSLSTWATPFGDFVTYFVVPVDSATDATRQQAIAVGNGHLILEAV